ncbi:isochorismatase family protein [Corynebacterium sp. ED61]|uniref:isochorismatase family protein n=1 Tax=Corynebacterium TaxID=1716 RepID=UPI001883D09F|nr:isochorismatase family protein [Corynebacterium sp. ED61]MBF0581140.1 isochorismatase family protein [Corynebacterium sp. ED61]
MSPRRALVIVDVQKDFVDGSLGTARGAEVAAAISSFLSSDANKYAHIVGTLDWHVDPAGHFVAAGEQPDYSETWPVHCVAGTEGATTYPALDTSAIEAWFRKGEFTPAYSGFEGHLAPAFAEADWLKVERKTIGLEQWLQDRKISHVDVVGIATDFCVKATALDSQSAGFHTTVIEQLCAPVSDEGAQEAFAELRAAGVLIS